MGYGRAEAVLRNQNELCCVVCVGGPEAFCGQTWMEGWLS